MNSGLGLPIRKQIFDSQGGSILDDVGQTFREGLAASQRDGLWGAGTF